MKNYIKQFAILLVGSILAGTAFGDVKIRTRQTMSGQIYERTVYIRGKRQRTEQNISGMQTINLTQCDLKRGVQLNPQAQVYMIDSWLDDTEISSTVNTSGSVTTEVKKGGVITSASTTKDTGEKKKMFGYPARHLIITTEMKSSPNACTQINNKMQIDGWYIDAAFALDCDYQKMAGSYGGAHSGGCRDKYDFKQTGSVKRGYPVYEKTTMFDETGKENYSMINEVVELSNAILDQTLFEIPKDYREVKNSSAMYISMSSSNSNSTSSNSATRQNSPVKNSSINSTISLMNSPQSENDSNSSMLEAKKEGKIRVGLAEVKTGAVGEGLNASDLGAAIQNSLPQYLKGTKIEIVNLEAKLASVIESEAEEKDCDYVLYATVSHKKGGGGFGGFGKTLGGVIAQTGGGAWGGTTANVAGAVAARTASAALVSQNVKSKDEITLEVKLMKSGAQPLTKQFKAKAQGDGDDIVSNVVEQAANAIVETVGK